MTTVWDAKIDAILDCAHASAGTPDTPAGCADRIREACGRLHIDSAELATAVARLRTTTIDSEFCQAVAAELAD